VYVSHPPRKLLFLLVFTITLASATLLAGTTHVQGARSGGEAAPAAEFSMANVVVGEGRDFATTVLGDPWDMSSIKDIYNEKTQNINSAAGVNRMAIEDGMLAGMSTNNDPHLFLVWGGFDHHQNASRRYGTNTPVDADYFRYLVVRMYLSEAAASDGGRVVWSRDRNLQQLGISRPFRLQPGWFTYVIDLRTIGVEAGGVPWSGAMQALRLNPTSRANVHIKIDWVRLVAEHDLPTYDVTWSEREGAVSLYATKTQSYDRSTVIATSWDARHGAYRWPVGLMEPGNYYIYRTVARDYATLALGQPWDLTSSSQYTLNEFHVHSNSGGRLRVSPTGNDPYITLRLDQNTPINAGLFKRFSFRMNSQGLNPGQYYTWQIFWRQAGSPEFRSIAFQGELRAGEHTYSVDLSNVPGWSGNLEFLRLDIASNANMNNSVFDFDWVALTTGFVPGSESELQSTHTISGPVTVKEAPRVDITAPSRTSGADYATSVLGDPWDMCNSSDISRTNEIESLRFANCIASYTDDLATHQTTPLTGDPQLTLRTGAFYDDKRTPIDTLRYRYVTYRYKENRTQDTMRGSVNRFVFWPNVPQDNTTLHAVVTNEGWETYSVDLANAPVEPTTPRTWTQTGYAPYFRFDPNEFPGEKVSGELDYILLTSQPWADQSYTIQWSRTGGDAGATVRLYADTDLDPHNGKTFIGQTIMNAGSFLWNTAGVAEGNYYIFMELSDGASGTRNQYSEVPIRVKRQASVTFGPFERTLIKADDFAGEAGNPWDFNDGLNDIQTFPHLPAGHSGLANVSAQGGMLSALTTNDDPYLFLNMRGRTIDTAAHRTLTFRMFSGRTDGVANVRFIWIRPDGSTGSSGFIPVFPGWDTYTVDLSRIPEWNGTVQHLRLDPARSAGFQFSVDWVRLTRPARINLSWTPHNFTPNTRVSLYAVPAGDPDNPVLIANNIAGTSFNWDYSGLLWGNYRIMAMVDDRISDINVVSDNQITALGRQGQPTLDAAPTQTALVALTSPDNLSTITINNSGGGILNWQARSLSPDRIEVLMPSGSTAVRTDIPLRIKPPRTPGVYTWQVQIDAGAAGSRTINVQVTVVERFNTVFLPAISR
jgi:hypothetical protein